MKPIVLPGENLTVKLLKRGEEQGQGVGYLDDGTMVVAEQGAYHLGETVRLTVTSVLQTSAGRMIFGRIGSLPVGNRAAPRTRRHPEAGPAPNPAGRSTRRRTAAAAAGGVSADLDGRLDVVGRVQSAGGRRADAVSPAHGLTRRSSASS